MQMTKTNMRQWYCTGPEGSSWREKKKKME